MPAPRMGRLGGLRNPAALKRPRGPPHRQALDPQHPCCDNPQPEEDNGAIICKNCYVQLREENIVSEVTFEEQTGGRATVQGGTVAEGSRFAKTLGPGAHRRGIGGERNSFADIQNAGRRALQQLCPKLGIENNVSLQAESIWSLAANINFSAGRRTDEVVAACLYAACRRQKQNPILLMDIAELLKINVFRLGEVYKDLCKTLYLRDESVGHQFMQELEPLIKKYCNKLQFADKTKEVAQDALRIIRRMNRDWIVDGRHPAGLCGACIILAARMNNFRRSVREVVYVAKIADITIAKRIEEFRRTKSAGLTVEQFRQFANKMRHQHDPPALLERQLKQERMEKRRQNRAEHMQNLARQSEPRESQPLEIPDDATDVSSRLSSIEPDSSGLEGMVEVDGDNVTRQLGIPPPTPPMTQEQLQDQMASSASSQTSHLQETPSSPRSSTKRSATESLGVQDLRKRQRLAAPGTMASSPQASRYDADGFLVPALPLETSPTGEEEPRRKRGRPRKEEQPLPIVVSEEELAEEDYLEKQIEAALKAGEVQESSENVEADKEKERKEVEARAKVVAEEQRKLDAQRKQILREASGTSEYWNPSTSEHPTAEDLEKEFENDPEVMNCELSAEEVRIKEQIWVTHNEDWLRKQAEREMLAKVARATGQGKRGKRGAKDGKRKKRSKMGDGSVLTETSTPIETPADAARAMLEKRAPLKSQHVDFGALQRIYGRETPSRASSATPEGSDDQTGRNTPLRSRDSSQAPSESAVAGAESPAGDADGDEEDAAEEVIASPVAATWENMDDDDPELDPDDMEAENNDYRRLLANQSGADEFGMIDDAFEGEDYEGYD